MLHDNASSGPAQVAGSASANDKSRDAIPDLNRESASIDEATLFASPLPITGERKTTTRVELWVCLPKAPCLVNPLSGCGVRGQWHVDSAADISLVVVCILHRKFWLGPI
jgi:hypothetical protein